MNHLNIFNSFKNKDTHHEDELTRCFLLLLKHVPKIRMEFFKLMNEDIRDTSFIPENSELSDIYTQLSSKNKLFTSGELNGMTLISVLISDDKYHCSQKVQLSDRNAVYDGMLITNDNLIIIIENKPSKDDVWENQLNPNLKNADITIIKQPCTLSWRDIISNFNQLIADNQLPALEKVLAEDFIEYVDTECSWLNPYTHFKVCKNSKYLLDKRCVTALNKLSINGKTNNVQYHKGWKHYVPSDKQTIMKIALDSETTQDDWTINLYLYAAETIKSARETYKKLDMEHLNHLKQKGYHITSNLHLSYRSSNLYYIQTQ